MAIINNLKTIRKQQNLNQRDLAKGTGTCIRTISRIECGERNPSLEMALSLAKYLDVSVEDLFGLTE